MAPPSNEEKKQIFIEYRIERKRQYFNVIETVTYKGKGFNVPYKLCIGNGDNTDDYKLLTIQGTNNNISNQLTHVIDNYNYATDIQSVEAIVVYRSKVNIYTYK
jgi:hypothetical protein